MSSVHTDDFLYTIYGLSELGEDRVAVDCIIEVIDDLLCDGRFTECGGLLTSIQVNKLSDPLLVTFLGITKAAWEYLPNRVTFYEQVWSEIAQRRGDDGADKLLKKYL